MGACCTTTQQETKPNTEQAFVGETDAFITNGDDRHKKSNVSHEQRKTHQAVVATDSDDETDHHKNKSNASIEERIKMTHEKFTAKIEHKDTEETDANGTSKSDESGTTKDAKVVQVNNKQLIEKLINEAPSTTQQSSVAGETDSGSSKRGQQDPLYDMLSTEELRYVISDLIEQHNPSTASEKVSAFNIRKLLAKWRSFDNLKALYLRLLQEYGLKDKIDRVEMEKNLETHRLAREYRMGKKLGRGAYAIVKQAKRVSDGKMFAAKLINKKGLSRYDLRGLELEIAIMRDLEHANVVTLYDVYTSKEKIGLILGLLQGGELLNVVIEKGKFSERQASLCFAQLLSALEYIHGKSIAHRDLKPDNLLFSIEVTDEIWRNLPAGALKLADFGLAERVKKKKGLTEYCGTPIYMAPEIYAHKEYDYSCDMWSAGCILYAILVGYPPYDFGSEHDLNELSRCIRQEPVEFDVQDWRGISVDAVDLIRKLLEKNPKKRWTAKQALNHKWMKTASSALFDDRRMERLRRFQCIRKMKRGVNAMIAVIRMIEIFEWFSEEKKRFDHVMGDTHDNVKQVEERQKQVIDELDKLNFEVDKLETRIYNLQNQNQHHEYKQDDAYNVTDDHDGQVPSIAIQNDDGDDDSDDENDTRHNFDRPSSLHQTSTQGRILNDADDDSD